MKHRPTEIWRVRPAPELDYASPTAMPPRTHSGFGLASLLLGGLLAVTVSIAAFRAVPWSQRDGDQFAVAALPLCAVGVGLGIVGSIRRSKRRTLGGLGLLLNIAVGLAVTLLWLVTHIPGAS